MKHKYSKNFKFTKYQPIFVPIEHRCSILQFMLHHFKISYIFTPGTLILVGKLCVLEEYDLLFCALVASYS
jgi:hypothetical protein